MTEDEIVKIKEHIETHARLEPRAIHITEIMRRAVVELEHIAELKEQNEATENGAKKYAQYFFETNEQLTKAKKIIRDLLGCLYSVEYDRVSDLEDAEQFLKEE